MDPVVEAAERRVIDTLDQASRELSQQQYADLLGGLIGDFECRLDAVEGEIEAEKKEEENPA